MHWGKAALAVLTVNAITLGQSSYSLRTMAGSDEVGDGGPATSALIAQAEGIALDFLGNLYIADADGHRIRRVTPAGLITTVAGTGHAGFGGDGGTATAARLNTPYGVAADRSGNLYIADLGNARIRRVSRDGVISTYAGGGSISPAAVDGRRATEAALTAPRNIVTDASGNVYFSDFGAHRVYQINPSGVILRFAGIGSAGLAGDGGLAVFAQLKSPAGLAIDSTGTLFVADSGNGRIRKIWRGVISTLGDTGMPGARPSVQPGTPTSVAVDLDGSVFIADPGGVQLLRVTPLLQVTAVAQNARDLALDPAGILFSCAGSFVQKRLRNGALMAVAGSGSYGFWGDGGGASRARLNQPSSVTHDSAGNLYIADTANNRIRRVTPDGVIFTIAGTGAAGAAGDGGPAVTAQLNAPLALLHDGAAGLYIADTGNHKVRHIDAFGMISTIAGQGQPGFSGENTLALLSRLDTPSGLAMDSVGALYIADTGNHLIRRIGRDGIIATLAGNANRGFSGDGGDPLLASLDSPRAVAVDSDGNVYIADTGNRRVRRLSAAGAFGPGIISTYPQNDAAIWKSPRGVAVDHAGNLFVSDAVDQHIFRVEPAGRITMIAGTGAQSFTGEAGPALASALDTPLGLSVDRARNLYFADAGNNRLRMLTPITDIIQPPPVIEAAPAILNAASLLAGPVVPGEIVSIYGVGFGSQPQVTFNGLAAMSLYTSDTQLNVVVPGRVAGLVSVDVQVVAGGVVKSAFTAGVAAAFPGIFAASSGMGNALAVNEDGALNSPENPADRGSVLSIYATGTGLAGLPLAVKMGDYLAQIEFAGDAPGFPGVMQINARIPSGFAPPGTLPLMLQVGTAASQPGVVIVVR